MFFNLRINSKRIYHYTIAALCAGVLLCMCVILDDMVNSLQNKNKFSGLACMSGIITLWVIVVYLNIIHHKYFSMISTFERFFYGSSYLAYYNKCLLTKLQSQKMEKIKRLKVVEENLVLHTKTQRIISDAITSNFFNILEDDNYSDYFYTLNLQKDLSEKTFENISNEMKSLRDEKVNLEIELTTLDKRIITLKNLMKI